MSQNPPPLRIEERLGRAWGAVFVAIVLILAAVLFGKGCFFSG